jgi:hypothetical protein
MCIYWSLVEFDVHILDIGLISCVCVGQWLSLLCVHWSLVEFSVYVVVTGLICCVYILVSS